MRAAITSVVAALLVASIVGCGDGKTKVSAGGDKTKTPADGEVVGEKKKPDPYAERDDWGIPPSDQRISIPIKDSRLKLAYSPAPSHFVATNHSVYDLETGDAIGRISGEWKDAQAARALNHNGSLFAICYRKGISRNVDVVSTKNGQQVATLPISDGRGTLALQFLDGDRLIWVGPVGSKIVAILWNARIGAEEGKVTLGSVGPSFAAISPNHTHVAVGGSSKVEIYDLKQKKRIAVMPRPSRLTNAPSNYSNLRGLAYSPSGDEVAGMLLGNDVARIIVWDRTAKVVDDHLIPGIKRRSSSLTPRTPLQWLSDGRGWLVSYNTVVDRLRKLTVWRFQLNSAAEPPAKVIGSNRILLISKRKGTALVSLNVPWKDIDAALNALDSGAPSIIRPGDSVRLDIQIGSVRFGSKEELRAKFVERLERNLRASMLTVGENSDLAYSVTYSEQVGATTAILEGNQFEPKDTGRTTTQTTMQVKVRFTADGGRVLFGSKERNVRNSRHGIVSSTDPLAMRNSRLSGIFFTVGEIRIPYFVARDPEIPRLPLWTKP